MRPCDLRLRNLARKCLMDLKKEITSVSPELFDDDDDRHLNLQKLKLSLSHSDADVEHTLACYAEVLPILQKAVEEGRVREALRGEPVEPVFRRTSKFDTKPRKENA